jgi:hypothetical protein
VSDETGDASDAWEQFKTSASENGETNPKRVFSDDTLNLLSLVPLTTGASPIAPTVTVLSPDAPSTSPRPIAEHRRSVSASASVSGPSSVNASAGPSAISPSKSPVDALLSSAHSKATVTSSWTFTDWAEFQSLGFTESSSAPGLAATLRETDPDVEVTKPPSPRPASPGLGLSRNLSRKSSLKRPGSPASKKGMPRLSLDIPSSAASTTGYQTVRAATPPPADEPKPRTTQVLPVQLDEAFVDAWADALTDPVSAQWPQFVLAQLKAPLRIPNASQGNEIEWVVLERTFTRPAPPPRPAAASTPALSPSSSTSPTPAKSTASPRPSAGAERMSSTFSATKRRFGFFSRTLSGQEKKEKEGKKDKGKDKRAKSPVGARVGEMGEILQEEPEESKPKDDKKGLGISDVATAAAGVTAAAGAAAAAATVGSGKLDPAAVYRSLFGIFECILTRYTDPIAVG